ncbi:class I SAM-dependent methyltransferase [Altericista sp. CCNU0014]|uniref:class I SAM-dependent methyltransferase n=1 Tax=Altericista sp. CCNU0014 TaxID=3082949 RepID=UPI00385068C3
MNSISDTARAVAMYRALETERPDALFQDTHARLLAGGRGEMMVKIVGNDRQIANLIAVRTYLIDEIIERLVSTEKIDLVLNLAAGLDMRPYRLALPSTLRWIEVDLPDLCEYKDRKLWGEKPSCTLERVKLDLTHLALRTALFATANLESKNVLILTEGLLSYLSEEQVKLLSADLYQQSNFRWWLFEMMSSVALKPSVNDWSQKIANQYLSDGKPVFLYAPEVGAEFFQNSLWSIAETHYVWEKSRHLNRGVWFAGLSEFLIRRFAQENWDALRQHNRIVLLEKQSPPRAELNSSSSSHPIGIGIEGRSHRVGHAFDHAGDGHGNHQT